MGGVVAEVALRALIDTEVADVVGVALVGQRVVPAVGHAGLRGVFCVGGGWTDAYAAVGGGVGEGPLAGRAVGDTSAGVVVSEGGHGGCRADVDAETGVVFGVGALGAPLYAAAGEGVAVVVVEGGAGALGHAEVGGVVGELPAQAGVDADVELRVAVALGVVWTLHHAEAGEVVGKSCVGTVLHAGLADIFSKVTHGAYFHTRLSEWVSVCLNGECVLAAFSAESAVVIRVSDDSSGSHPGFA